MLLRRKRLQSSEILSISLTSNEEESQCNKMVEYPPPPADRSLAITIDDYHCLAKGKLLNDTIIEFYLQYLMLEVLSERDRNRTHVFNSCFYEALTNRHNLPLKYSSKLTSAAKRYANVHNWTKNVNIFHKDFVIIPINSHQHWFLAIICFPGLVGTLNPSANKSSAMKAPSASIKSPCILIFDSLASANCSTSNVFAVLRDYLSCEYVAKFDTEKTFTKYTIKGFFPKVPQQSNTTDCGIYLLQYVEHFFKNPIRNFTLPIKPMINWFNEIVIIRKREEIANLLIKLMKQSANNNVTIPKLKFPTINGRFKRKLTNYIEFEGGCGSKWKRSDNKKENFYTNNHKTIKKFKQKN